MNIRNIFLILSIAVAISADSFASAALTPAGSTVSRDQKDPLLAKEAFTGKNIPVLVQRLIEAIKTREIAKVAQELKAAPLQEPMWLKMYFNYKDSEKKSPLIVAITLKNRPIVELLIASGAPITPNVLIAAKIFGQAYVFNPQAAAAPQQTAAAGAGASAIVKDYKSTPLEAYAELTAAGDQPSMEFAPLAADTKQKLEHQDSDAETEEYVGKYPRSDLMNMIKNNLFNLKEFLNSEEHNALMCAAAINDVELAMLIISVGFKDFLAQDMSGDHALAIAVRSRHIEMVELLSHHISLETRNGVGETALIAALSVDQALDIENEQFCEQQLAMVQCLIDLGSNVNAVDARGIPPLIHSISNNNPATTALLLKHGANARYEDPERKISSALAVSAEIATKNSARRQTLIELTKGKTIAQIDADAATIFQMLRKNIAETGKKDGEKDAKSANDKAYEELMQTENAKAKKKKQKQRKQKEIQQRADGEVNTDGALAQFYELQEQFNISRIYKRTRPQFAKRKAQIKETAKKYVLVAQKLAKSGYTGWEIKKALAKSYLLFKWSI